MSTIQQALSEGQSRLSLLPDISTKLESEILLAFTIQTNRTYLYTWPEKSLENHQLAKYQSLLERRINGEPIAYITEQLP